MSEKWLEILSQYSHVDQQKLLDYLEGRLSEEEKHEVEKMMADSEFINDAIEGLENMKDKQKIATVLYELNNSLSKRIQQRRGKQSKKGFPDLTLIITATVTILLLIILAYIIYRMYTTP
jgi:tRNA U54 and U55 pseudouridine synthase Pus10